MKQTGWSTFPTHGGSALTSRWTQKRVAATDHCVAIIRRCPQCFESYIDHSDRPDLHRCADSA